MLGVYNVLFFCLCLLLKKYKMDISIQLIEMNIYKNSDIDKIIPIVFIASSLDNFGLNINRILIPINKNVKTQ